jgi:polar amino acid transport system substrate-binding protein
MSVPVRIRSLPGLAVLASLAVLCFAGPASARTLAAIRDRGSIGLCAHPNSLPFASRTAQQPGFQIEFGRALAQQLGVSLAPDWVLISYQIPRTDCDLILDTIAASDAPPDFGIKLSKPYYRSGVILAVPPGSAVTSFNDLNSHTKVAVQTGSLAAMTIDRRHVPISVFGFEEDMLAALAAREVDAAAVTPLTAGYYNLQHPDHRLTLLPPDEDEHDLVWNVAVGMRRPDDALRQAIDQAIDRLTADGVIAGIYRRYGVALQAPR